jgi:hypothetical protein
MASPFRLFRKNQKLFLALAAGTAIFVFILADPLSKWLQQQSGVASGNTGAEIVAEWDGGSINKQELSNLVQRRYFISEFLRSLQMLGAQRILEEGGSPTQPTVPNFIFSENPSRESVSADVVTHRIFSELAHETGISISDKLVNHYLNETGLRQVTGAEIQQLLKSGYGGMGVRAAEAQLFSGLREMLQGEYFMNSYGSALRNVSPEQRWQDWRQINNRIALEAAILPAAQFLDKTADPSDEELKEFFASNRARIVNSQQIVAGVRLPSPLPGFREPRRVKLQYLQGDVNVWTDKYLDSVTDEEIADFYERNKRTMFVKPEGPAEEAASVEEEEAETDEEEAQTEESESAESEEKTEETSNPVESEAPVEEAEKNEPAETEPAETESEPAKEENPAAEAASEEPAEESTESSEVPEAEDSSRIEQRNPFQLASLQEEAEDEADSEEAATEEEQPAEEASDSEEAAPAVESTDDSADDVADAVEVEVEEEVEYELLELVSDDIRRRLAEDKAVVELQNVMELVLAELNTEFNKYSGELISAQTQEKEQPAVPTSLADLSSLAEKHGLSYNPMKTLSPREMEETIVGKAVDSQTRSRPVSYLAFASMKLHEPMLAQDIDGQWFLVIKSEDIASHIPEFDEIRENVVTAWKQSKAAELALETAQQLAKDAQAAGGTLADFMADKGYDVKTTDLFSARTFGITQAEMRRGAILGEAPPLSAVGPEFMEEAFQLEPEQAVALQNHDHSDSYVVRLDRREKTEEEMRQLFLSEANSWRGLRPMTSARWQLAQQQLQQQLNQRTGFDSEKFSNYLQEMSNR